MLFSIIIPCYNIEAYISMALDSVLNQTYSAWECICVNDGSTDNTKALLDDYARRDSRIKVYSQSNQGVSSARNLGLSKMRGEWLLFLDGDDVLHPQALELCQMHISKHDMRSLDGVVFRGIASPSPNFPDRYEVEKCSRELVDCSQQLPYNLLMSGFFMCAYPATNKKRMVFKNYVATEDRLFWLTWLCAAKTMVVLDAELYGYRQRQGSAMNSPENPRKTLDAFNATMEIIEQLERTKKQLSRIYLRHLNVYLFEKMPYHIYFDLKNEKKHASEIRRRWLESIRGLSGRHCVTPWYRLWLPWFRLGLSWVPIGVFLFCYRLKLLRNRICIR